MSEAPATPEQTGVEYTSGNAGGMHDCGHEGNLTVTPGAGIPRSSAGTGFTAPPRRFFSPQKKVRNSGRRSGTLRGDAILPSCFLQEYLPVGMLTLCERVSRLPEGKEAERHRHSGCSLAGSNGRPLPRPHRNPLQRGKTNFFCRQSGGAKSPPREKSYALAASCSRT